MKATVNILIVSLADDTPGHRCLLTLDDDDPQAGGNWWSNHAMGSSNPGQWRFVAAESGPMIADSGKEWSLRGLSNPMGEGTTGLGQHKAAYRFIGVGEVAWKVLSVGNLARKWESEEFDPSVVKSNSE
jgi:hypothetical protein